MPTDVSKPIWACDVCGSRHGEDRDGAAACEALPVPKPLPEGALILGGGPSWWVLQSVEEVSGPARPESRAVPSHVFRYRSGANLERSWDSASLVPHKADRLNVAKRTLVAPGDYGAGSAEGRSMVEVAARLAIVDGNAEEMVRRWEYAFGEAGPRLHRAALVGPLSAEVRDCLDALGVTPARYRTLRGSSRFGALNGRVNAILADLARRGGGRRAAAVAGLLTYPVETGLDDLDERQAAWWGGEDLVIPMPRWAGKPRLAPSRLDKAQRGIVTATGVPWAARTNEHEYATRLVGTLEVEMVDNPRIFPVPVVAVGGGKGGVGKTTVAAALAVAVAATGRRVLLVDLDFDNPSQALLWGLGDVPVDRERRLIRPTPLGVGGVGVFSVAQLLADGEPLRWGAGAARRWVEFCGGALDYDEVDMVVADLGPGWTPAHDVLCGPGPRQVDAWLHVSTGHRLSVMGTERLVTRMRDHAGTQLIVENLSRQNVVVDGVEREVRVAGDDTTLAELAGRGGAEAVGSLRYVTDPVLLGATDEMSRLAEAVVAACALGSSGAG